MIESSLVSGHADLAQAAYVDFGNLLPGQVIAGNSLAEKLKSAMPDEWPEARAQEFAKFWRVVSHVVDNGSWIPSSHDGFSATVFERLNDDGTPTGQYVYAPRGTADLNDIFEDIGNLFANGLAWQQIVAMYNHWQRISTPVGQSYKEAVITRLWNPLDWGSATVFENDGAYKITVVDSRKSGEGIIPQDGKVGVAGHSLGGHLATAFSRLFTNRVSDVLSVNGAGYSILGELTGNVDRTFAALGGSTQFNTEQILNIYGNRGFEFTTQNYWFGLRQPSPSGTRPLYIENALNSSLGHGAGQMAQSAALCEMLRRIDPAAMATTPQMLELFNKLAPAGSSVATEDFEGVLDAMRRLFLDDGERTVIGDEADFYGRLYSLQNASEFQGISGKVEIAKDFDGAIARTDFAAMASLYLATTFQLRTDDIATMDQLGQVHGGLYADWQSDISALLAGADSRDLHFTDLYLHDRSRLLNAAASAYSEDSDKTTGGGAAIRFADLAYDIEVFVNDAAPDQRVQVVFGDFSGNALSGFGRNDNLYGMGGDDTLSGQDGCDWLEGGDGQDVLDGGDGRDVLLGGLGADTFNGGLGIDHHRGGGAADTYKFEGDWSTDEVVDADGGGQLQIEGYGGGLPPASVKVANGIWRSADGKVAFTRIDNESGGYDLIVSFTDKQGRIVLRNWESGWFGINLGGAKAMPPVTSLSYLGDQRAKTNHERVGDGNQTYRWDLTTWLPNGTLSGGVAEAGFSDVISGASSADLIDGRAGNDALDGESGDDLIRGGDGNDLIAGGTGKDWIEGGIGNDFIMTAGNLEVQRQRSRDDPKWTPPPGQTVTISGDTWGVTETGVYYANKAPVTDTASDYVDGGEGNDSIHGAQGADTLLGGTGNDLVMGAGGADVLNTGDGDDWAIGDGPPVPEAIGYCPPELYGADVINLGSGKDVGFGWGSNDVLFGGSGDDVLWGDNWVSQLSSEHHGEDFLDGGVGNDVLIGGAKDDVLYGGQGDDTLYGDDYVDGAATGNDALYGGDGGDRLYGDKGNDALDGGAGDDEVSGGDGDDTLIGGFGVDAFFGGSGDDLFVVGAEESGVFTQRASELVTNSYAELVVTEGGETAYRRSSAPAAAVTSGWTQQGVESVYDDQGQNTVQVHGSLTSADANEDGDLSVHVADGRGAVASLTLVNAFFGDLQSLVIGGQSISLRDWVQDNVSQSVRLTTEGADVAYAFGAGGDDWLQGASALNDTLDGGAGHDTLYGYGGTDSLIGAEGNDSVLSGDGDDTLRGGEGDDYLWADDGNDVIEGGTGNDTIKWAGGEGDDVFLFGRGDGQDTLEGIPGIAGETNTLKLGADITPADVMVRREFGEYWDDNGRRQTGYIHLRVTILSTGDSFLVQDFSRNDDPFGATNPLQRIEFENGTAWDLATICTQAGKGSQFDDHILGFSFAQEVLEGLAGNDSISGNGADTVLGGDGDDYLGVGENGIADGGNGNDFVSGKAESTLIGGAGDDRIEGGRFIDAGEGNDSAHATYNVDFLGGAGDDNILTDDDRNATQADHAVLRGGLGDDELDGGLYTDVYFDRGDGNDIYFGYSNTSADANSSQRGKLHLGGGITAANLKPSLKGDDLFIDLGQGDSITLGRYFSGSVAGSTEKEISIGEVIFQTGESRDIRSWLRHGTNSADTLAGTTGDDVMAGYGGNDTLNGGLGNDGLHGGDGSDSLVGGDGNDTLTGGAARDTLVGGLGDDVYYLDDMDATISEAVGAGVDTVVYRCIKYFPDTEYTLLANFENLILSEDAPTATVPQMGTGNAAANRIVANSTGNTLRGLGGTDTLVGGRGDDSLDGGTGVDSMEGGQGDDIYYVDDVGDAAIEDASAGLDTVVAAVDWTLGYEIENLELTGTALIGVGNGLANLILGNGASNTLMGMDGNDTLDGGSGNDRLEGGAGSDTYLFSAGSGKDTVTDKDASSARDQINFGSLTHDAVNFTHVGNDLEVKIVGTADKLVIKNWYLGTKYQVEDFVFADGTWTNDQVAPAANRLIDAMARFGGRSPGLDSWAPFMSLPIMGHQTDLSVPMAMY